MRESESEKEWGTRVFVQFPAERIIGAEAPEIRSKAAIRPAPSGRRLSLAPAARWL